MQSRKASKKVPPKTNEAVVDSVVAAEGSVKKPRAAKSVKPKQEASREKVAAKNHRKVAVGASSLPATESSFVAHTLPEPVEKPQSLSTAVAAETPVASTAVVDSVGVLTSSETYVNPSYSQGDIAKLAYSYWISRDYAHGFADEDWLRAEAELASKQ